MKGPGMQKILKLSIPALLIVVLPGCVSEKIVKTKAYGLPAYKISNQFISMTVLPDSNGRIADLKYDGIDLLFPYQEKRVIEDPLLPEMVFSNMSGCKEWFWGKVPLSNCTMNVTSAMKKANQVELDMVGRYYQSQDFSLRRRLILEKSVSAVTVETTLKNLAEEPESATLWVNIIPNNLSGGGKAVYPVRGKADYAAGRAVTRYPEDQVVTTETQMGKNNFLVPGQPWTARVYPRQKIVMVFATDMANLAPDGAFYSWHGPKDGEEIRTMEIIYSPIKLAPGKTRTMTSRLLVFKGLSGISTICGDVALDSKTKNTSQGLNIVLDLSSVRRYADLHVKTCLVKAGTGKTVPETTREFAVSELNPGQSKTLKYILSSQLANGKYFVSGTINGNKFLIMKMIEIH
jgi:hypothetical protein